MLGAVGRGPDHQAPAVEVEDDGGTTPVAVAAGACGNWEVEARPQARGRVKRDVLGGDPGGGVHGGRDRVDREQALHAPALVLPDHRDELERSMSSPVVAR